MFQLKKVLKVFFPQGDDSLLLTLGVPPAFAVCQWILWPTRLPGGVFIFYFENTHTSTDGFQGMFFSSQIYALAKFISQICV